MMRWASWTIFAGTVLLAAVIGGNTALAQDGGTCADGRSPKELSTDVNAKFATAQQPARILLKEGPKLVSRSAALQLTLKPVEADPDTPFLVQVYAKNLCETKESGPGELLGVVSFFHLKPGEPVDFVLTPPEKGFPSVAPQDIELTVKLIPVNPAAKLANLSIEVVKARFAE
jgi:hypothetical protein